MDYKSILTVLTDANRAGATFAAAAEFALARNAHLEALCLGIDRLQAGYSFVGAGTMMPLAGQEGAQQEATAIEAAARHAASAQPATLRHSIEPVTGFMGGLTWLIGARARFADLVVLDQPYGEGRSPEEVAIVETALFDGLAPVLVLPANGRCTPQPRRIVLAWNQSREAMVAARRALPFLIGAELVTITVIDPPAHGPERSDPGGALCQMLARHGVTVEVSVLARSMPQISDLLARQVRDRDADLLVMGAYGHSRLREAILGGATRTMLEKAEVPVLMAH